MLNNGKSFSKIIQRVILLFIILVLPLIIYHLRFQQNIIQKAAEGEVIRGVAGDLWADIVIGKRSIGEIGAGEVVPDRLYQPGGVIVDTSVSPSFTVTDKYSGIGIW